MAAAVGLVAIAVLAAWSPYPFTEASRQYVRQASLQDYLSSLALKQGIPWFQRADMGTVCSTLASYSNSTVVVSALVDGLACGPRPQRVEFQANLSMDLGASRVNLQAWQVAGR